MKLIHTSDIHLASALTARLPSSKVRGRKKELMSNLLRLTEEAHRIGACGIIIAGDLFDSDRITKKELDSVLSVIEGARDIDFFYLPGNHERGALSENVIALPNLHIFGKEWTYFKHGGVTFVGRSETGAGMFSELSLDKLEKNIAVLHGEVRDKSIEGGVIGLREAIGRGLDYIALGHYHTHSQYKLDERTVAAYSGAPEGRGFDELGDMGYLLIDTASEPIAPKFIPFAKRKLIAIDTDISGALRTHDVEARISDAVRGISSENLIRINLTGSRELELRCDKDYLTEKFASEFYYFEIKDKSKLLTRAEDYRYDKSLRGEFIRLCLSDETLSDEEREKIIHCGLSALSGEAFDE